MAKKSKRDRGDLVFVCSRCGPGAGATAELKCDVCGRDCVIRRAVVRKHGRIGYVPLARLRG